MYVQAFLQMQWNRYIIYESILLPPTCKKNYVNTKHNYVDIQKKIFAATATEAVAQWSRAFAPQAEGWVFESQRRQT